MIDSGLFISGVCFARGFVGKPAICELARASGRRIPKLGRRWLHVWRSAVVVVSGRPMTAHRPRLRRPTGARGCACRAVTLLPDRTLFSLSPFSYSSIFHWPGETATSRRCEQAAICDLSMPGVSVNCVRESSPPPPSPPAAGRRPCPQPVAPDTVF